MRFSNVTSVWILAMASFTADAVKKKLLDIVTICRRNDPALSECYRTNFNRVLPILKNGAPKMNIMPIDPFLLENIQMDLPQTQSVKIELNLQNLTIYGFSKGHCEKGEAYTTSDGLQLYIDLRFPEIIVKSAYKAVGNFLLIEINGNGDFEGDFADLSVKMVWNSTLNMINGTDYLNTTGNIINIISGKKTVNFTHLFGNNIELNEHVNSVINENMDIVYEDIKPVIWETILRVAQDIVDDFHAAFSYDSLFPKE